LSANDQLAFLGEALRAGLAASSPPPPWPPELDGERLLQVARRHRVVPLLAAALRDAPGMPPTLVCDLHAAAAIEVREALQRARQLRRLLDHLRDAGIEALGIKGPLLAAGSYGDVGRRGASDDLDVAVRTADFVRTIVALAELGYRRVEPEIDEKSPEWEREARLVPAAEGVMVELHTELEGSTGTPSLEVGAVLARAPERELLGTRVRTLAPEDLLLYLCIHGARHNWSRLLWICDVAATLRSAPELDWDLLVQRATEIAARDRLACGLLLAARWLGVSPPLAVRQRLRLEGHRLRLAAASRRLHATAERHGKLPLLSRLGYELITRETTAQRLAFLHRHVAPNARDRSWLPLPPGLGWLRWPLRPLRLLVAFGRMPANSRK